MHEQLTQMLRSEVSQMIEQPEEAISDTANLADLGLDSLQALQLLVQIERTYRIQIPEDDIRNFTTIREISDLITAHIGGAALAEQAATG